MQRKLKLSLREVEMMANNLGDELKRKEAIITLKDGSRMTTTLYILENEGAPIINLSNSLTILFGSIKELNEYINKKCQVFNTDKEKWQTFTGMDDETWEEWNK